MWLAALIACNPDSRRIDIVDAAPFTEQLASGASEGSAGSGPAAVFGAPRGGWTWLDPRGTIEVAFGADDLPRAAGEASGNRFVLSDGVHVLLRDDAVPVGGEALAGRQILDLCGDGEQLWVTTDDGVVVWRGNVLADLLVDERRLTGPVACGGHLFGERVAWVADGDVVHAVAGRGNRLQLFESHALPAPIDGLAVDHRGRPWVASDGVLHRRRGDGWSILRLPEPVWGVLGGPASHGVWALTAGLPAFVPDEPALPVAVRPTVGPGFTTTHHGRWASDDLGRLIVRDDDGVHRVSIDRPLWVEGLADGQVITEVATLRLIPTLPAEVQEMFLVLEQAGVRVAVDPEGRATIDASSLSSGPELVRAFVRYADGGITMEQRSVILQPVGRITWSEHVRPIHEGSCALCHTNSAETILDGPEAWEAQIDKVLVQVQSGAMPLGRPDLTPDEIALIMAWAEGGFDR